MQRRPPVAPIHTGPRPLPVALALPMALAVALHRPTQKRTSEDRRHKKGLVNTLTTSQNTMQEKTVTCHQTHLTSIMIRFLLWCQTPANLGLLMSRRNQ